MAQSDLQIIIVGGGISGLATAAGLRGPGRNITILEQSREQREIGAAISLQPNASKILNSWGLESVLKSHGGEVDQGLRIYNAQGQLVRNVPFSAGTYGADRVVYHRVDLLEALQEAAFSERFCGPPAQLRLSSRVVACDCEAGTVSLSDGSSMTGDLIVGADGIHSKLRGSVTGSDIGAIPTGVSAYRIVAPTERIQNLPAIRKFFNSSDCWTSMMFGHDRRIIMGPCRQGELFGIVALVPDEHMHEMSDAKSWTSHGSLEHLLESFDVFPDWIKEIFKAAPSLGLWQLRDLDPLSTWVKGRVVLIGDASHAMLPTMGQGASQSIEDAEALRAYFADVTEKPSKELVAERLGAFFECRFERASLIQAYSRQQAQPATTQNGSTVTLDPVQFQDFCCKYDGAKDWAQRKGKESLIAVGA